MLLQSNSAGSVIPKVLLNLLLDQLKLSLQEQICMQSSLHTLALPGLRSTVQISIVH